MRRVIRLFLYTILALVITLWLALGLFKAEYLKGPLASWVQQQTGLPLTIGRLEFNPFYPNVLLAEQVKLGDLFTADKIYIEVASGSWLDRTMALAHLDVIAPRINYQAGQRLPSLPLQGLTIQDLNIERLALLTPGGSRGTRLGGVSLHVSDWQPLAQGQWQPLQQLDFTLDAYRLEWQGIPLAKVVAEGQVRQGVIQLKESRGKLLDGGFTAKGEWDTRHQRLSLQSLELNGQRISLNRLPQWPWQQVNLVNATLSQVSLTDEQHRLNLNNLSGQLQGVQWQLNHPLTGLFNGTLGELSWGSHALSELQGELRLSQDEWQGKLNGQWWEGQIKLQGHYQPNQRTLTLDEASLDQLQAELPADWRAQLPQWPIDILIVRRLDVHHLAWLSYYDPWPFSLKGGELFATDLKLTREGVFAADEKARLEASWGELVYDSLVSRGGELQGEITVDTARLRSLTLPLEQGVVTADGQWSRNPATPHQLNLTAKQLDLEKLSDLLASQPEFAGTADVDLALQSQGTNRNELQTKLQGTLNLHGKDLFLDGFKLDEFLEQALDKTPGNSDGAHLYHQLQNGDTAVNRMALQLTAQQGVIQLQGAASTITHQLGLRGQLDLGKEQWQSEWGLLNDKGCAELSAKMQGPFANPNFSFSSHRKGCAHWERLGVPYPPQGRQGSLRG